MRDRARIVHRHDATLTASNADPSPALCIKSPLQSHRAAACDALLSLVVSSLMRALLRFTRPTTPPACPSIALDDRSRRPHDRPARQASAAPVQTDRLPISPMRRVRSEDFVSRENCERERKNTHSVNSRASISIRVLSRLDDGKLAMMTFARHEPEQLFESTPQLTPDCHARRR
jgi:hypothetical protein